MKHKDVSKEGVRMNLKYAFLRLAGSLVLMQPHGTAQSQVRKMALTFDDLPYSSNVRDGWLANAKRGTMQILEVLNRHRAPAIAFVIEANLQGQDGRVAFLQQWLDAGMTL